MTTEISDRGGALVEAFRAGVNHATKAAVDDPFESVGPALGDRAEAHAALVAYIAGLESVAHASQSAIDACGDPVCSTCAPMIAALAALDAVKP